MKYELRVTETKRQVKYLYEVIDEAGNVVSSRRSDRVYVACTINGAYYFGRVDLVGKGNHGNNLKWCLREGREPSPVAYCIKNKPSSVSGGLTPEAMKRMYNEELKYGHNAFE